MKKLYSFFSILIVFGIPGLSYSNYQIVTIKDIHINNMNSEYRKVPNDFKCHVRNKENELCYNSKGIRYIFNPDLYFGQGYINVNQYLTYLEGELNNRGTFLIKSYEIPKINQYITQEDSRLLFRQSERVITVIADLKLPNDRLSIAAIVFKFLPNNGSPVTDISGYSVEFPESLVRKYERIKNDFFIFMMSGQYDANYVQVVNARHSQFLANLRAREGRFYESQSRTHQSNMKALDDSYNAYRQRSERSDQSHNAFIDSIHERRQMTDSSTGQKYNVDGYYDHNYVNPNNINQQIQTNDHLLDPNINNNVGEYYQELE